MSDITRLANTLMKLDDKLCDCMRCGLCQAVCPVFGATMKEADVSRGKLALLDNLAHEMIKDVDAVDEKLNRCLLCGSCQANCPSGVKILDIFMEARKVIVDYRGLNPIKKLVFRQLLTHPDLFTAAMRAAAPFQGVVMRKKGAKTYDMPLMSKLIGSRHIAKLPAKSLHATYGELRTQSSCGVTVLFFAGCMADKYYTNLGEACLKVLKHHGVGVVMPTALTCCGIPALASGDRKGFVKETEKNLAVIAQELIGGRVDYILTPCGSCTATLKEWWPHYASEFSPEDRKTIEAVASKVMDINQFLIDVLHVDQQEAGARNAAPVTMVTFHDSCHLKKSLGVAAQPRKLIKQNPNYELVEMKEADRCCGCGGSFTLFHYDLSKQIGQRKRENIVNSGAAAVASGCPACMLQLSDMLSQNEDAVQVKQPIEIYAEMLPN